MAAHKTWTACLVPALQTMQRVEEESRCEVRFCVAVLVTAAALPFFIYPGNFKVPHELVCWGVGVGEAELLLLLPGTLSSGDEQGGLAGWTVTGK